MTKVSRLRIRRRHQAGRSPEARLYADDVDLLDLTRETGHEPASPLLVKALLPQDPVRRIALWGCGCGAFACSAVTVRVEREGKVVEFADWRRVTGISATHCRTRTTCPTPWP